MEAGKTDSGKLEGAEKELEQLYYAWKTPTDIRAMEPMHQAFAAITAVQLWRWRQSRQFCGRCGAKTEDSKIERALVCPVCGQTEYPKISPAVIVAITNGDKLLMSRYRVNHSTYRGYALIAVGAPIAMKPKKIMLITNSPMTIACSGMPYFLNARPKKHPIVGTKLRLIDAIPVTATMEEP